MTEKDFAGKLDSHKNTVYRLAFSYLKNSHDAEDVTQEVFLKLFRNNNDFPSSENEKAWLIRVTANLCKNRLRSRIVHKEVELDENEITESVFLKSNLETLDMLSSLKPDYRAVIYLYYYERYTTAEIARILKRNENTIRTHLSRAREQLKINILEEGEFIYG